MAAPELLAGLQWTLTGSILQCPLLGCDLLLECPRLADFEKIHS